MQRSALCRSRRELSNEYLLAKIGVDTAENEPLKVWRKIQFIIHSPPYSRRPIQRQPQAVWDGSRGQPATTEAAARALVERFDIEPFPDFSAKWANFRGLVLFCIDAKFCKKIFVGKLLTRSTRFTCFCTAQTSIFQKNFVKLFRIFGNILQHFVIFEFFSLIFAQILMKFCRNFADNLENVEIFWIFWIF